MTIPKQLNEQWIERIMTANNEQAEEGMRVLGVAVRTADQVAVDDGQDVLEKEMIFVGMVSMMDPARPEVKEAVQLCSEAGIRPVMITGDHPLTAGKIAAELGIAENGRILTGQELEHLSDAGAQGNRLRSGCLCPGFAGAQIKDRQSARRPGRDRGDDR